MIRIRSGVLSLASFLLLCGWTSSANLPPTQATSARPAAFAPQKMGAHARPVVRPRGPGRTLLGVGECPTDIELELWPPNHKYVDIDLEQVLGPDVSSIEIVSITQDEPVDERGDGHTVCDGDGIGTSTAHIRSERSGRENGRVYEIQYSAFAGACTGFVRVLVPHDQSGRPAEDDGQFFDSTEGCK